MFDETKSYWTDETVDITMAAHARLGRIKTSQATNPKHELSELGTSFSFGESVIYVLILGSKETGTANRTLLEWFFGEFSPLVAGE